MGRKNEQHVVPRTYLKHWQIAPGQSFVYGIDFSNPFCKGPQRLGLNAAIFKRRKFYNQPEAENPYAIEDMLGADIEPGYDRIMAEVNQQADLSVAARTRLIQWLYTSSVRSLYLRNNVSRAARFLLGTAARYRHGVPSPQMLQAIDAASDALAKRVQLELLSDSEQVERMLNVFVATITAKHWQILMAPPQLAFWTNDNPGFSPNLHPLAARSNPYHPLLELNAASINFYPLSPKYCLELTPFEHGTPLDVNGLTMRVPYTQVDLDYAEFINRGVFHTRTRVVVSNSAETLVRYIRG